MKVALFNDSFPPIIDGVGNTVVNYARRLNNGTDEAIVVVPQHPDADDSQFSFPVVRYPGIDARKLTGYIAGNPFYPPVEKALKERNVDILHTHCPFASAILSRMLSQQIGAPLILTYHTKFNIDIEKVIKLKLLQEETETILVDNISACDEIWAVSKGAGDNLRSLGYEGDYVVMENGVDIPRGRLDNSETEKLTLEYNLPYNTPVYLFVGRLMWYKGIRIILDALAALKSQNYDFRMVFVGTGMDENEIRTYVEKLQLSDRVVFTGAVHDRRKLKALYCRSDLLLFPSTFDTNGLVVREAAACSLPAVLVKGSCAAEGTTSDRNAFLIEENAASLAVCLARLTGRKELINEAGRNAAEELYISWDDAVTKARARYEIVAENYKRGVYKKRRHLSDEILHLAGNQIDGYNRLISQYEETRKSLEFFLNEHKNSGNHHSP